MDESEKVTSHSRSREYSSHFSFPLRLNLKLRTSIATITLVTGMLGAGYAQSGLNESAWPIFRHDSQLTGRARAHGPSLPVIKFEAPLGNGELGAPVVGPDGTIYVPGGVDNNLYALSPSGQLLWTFTGETGSPHERFVASPALAEDGTLYIGSVDSCRFDTQAELSCPVQAELFYALNPDGTLRWKKKLDGGTYFSANIGRNGRIYVATDDCWLYALHPAGYLATPDSIVDWRYNLRAQPENSPALSFTDLPLSVAGDSLVNLYLYGSVRFKRSFGAKDTLQGLALDQNGNIYVTGRGRAVVRRISPNGAAEWAYSLPAAFGKPFLPAVSNGVVFFTSSMGGGLFALNAGDGSERWRVTLPGGDFLTPPVVDGAGHVYAVHSTAGLVCFSAAGVQRWSKPEVQASPVSPAFGADGAIYVSGDRRLYAISQGSPLSIEPAAIDFGEVCTDSTATQSLTLRNRSADAITVTAIVIDNPAFDVSTITPFQLEPGTVRQLSVQFTPTALAAYTGMMIITSDAGQSVVTLSGEGGGPRISLSAEPATFGELCIGEEGLTEVCIANPGVCTLRVDSIAVAFSKNFASGFAGIAQANEGSSAPIFIAPGEKFCFTVRARQNSLGNFEAKVTVWSTAGDSVALIIPGTVVPPAIAGSAAIDFGRMQLHQTASRLASVWNAGKCELEISELKIEGPQAASFALAGLNLPQQLTAGDTLDLGVSFTPLVTGVQRATLLVISDAEPDTLRIPLAGQGIPSTPKLVLVPADSLAIFACLGASGSAELLMRNEGGADLIVSGFAIDNPIFVLATSPLLPDTLAPNEELRLTVTFTPAAITTYRGVLTVSSNDPGSDATVGLIGTGGGPLVELAAHPPAFGEICLGNTANTRVCIVNPSACELQVEIEIIFSEGVVVQPATNAHSNRVPIQPGDSLCIPVTVKPGSLGPFEVEVRVLSNALNGTTRSVIIRGTVVSPEIAGVDSVKFGNVAIGASAEDPATVWSLSACAITVDSLRITGADAAAFSLGAITVPSEIPGRDTLEIPLVFTPEAERSYSVTLLVYNNDAQHNPLSIPLQGAGIMPPPEPHIVVTPPNLNFGEVVLTDDSTLTLTVRNAGGSALHILNIASSNEAFSASPDSFSVPALGSRTVEVTFTPRDTRDYAATLLISNNDIDSAEDTISVALRGMGVSPIAAPDQVSFGEVCVGESKIIKITLANRGTREIAAEELQLTLDRAEFTVTPRDNVVVPAGGSREIEVAFSPTAAGALHDTLRISWQQLPGVTISHTVVPLAGVGVSGQRISGLSTLDFDDTNVDESSTKTYVLSNVGTCPLQIESLRISGRDSSEFSLAPNTPLAFTIPSGGSQEINIIFSPVIVGAREAQLLIANNDLARNPKQVTLQGKGAEFDIVITPDTLIFSGVPVGASACDSVFIINKGTDAVSFSAAWTTEQSPFNVQGSWPLVVGKGGTSGVALCFAPPDTGFFSGQLFLRSSEDKIFAVVLQGRGIAPIIAGLRQLDFAQVLAESGTKIIPYVFENQGDVELIVRPEPQLDETAVRNYFRILDGGESYTIPPRSQSKPVRIAFTPDSTGQFPGKLLIYSNAYNLQPNHSPFEVSLKGEGIAPGIKVEATAIDFRQIEINTSAVAPVIITNTGTANLFIERITPLAAPYSLQLVEDFPPVPPGGSFVLEVKFSPGQEGRFEAQFEIHSNAFRRKQVLVQVTGAGIRTEKPQPCITVSSTELDFGRVRVRRDSTRIMEISNCGEAPLEITQISVQGEHFIIAEGGGFSLDRQETRTVPVTFKPRSAGAKLDEAVITSNDPAHQTVRVKLAGDGRANPNVAVRVTPAIFTPNGDSYNDEIKFDYKDFEVTEPVLRIFNIRGAVTATFKITDAGEFLWDGVDERRQRLNAGVYLWLIEDGGKTLGSGYISLVR